MPAAEEKPILITSETGRDHKVSTNESPALGLALSGGGVRTTLFSLGVVIGLIETGCHRRVRCVTSVSGGSILNAVLAHARGLGSFSTVGEFQPLASDLSARLAWGGAFAFDLRTVASALWFLARVVGRAIVPLAVALVTLASALREQFNFDLTHINFSKVPWQVVGGIALASVLVSVLLSRGLLQEAKYASVLGAVAAAGPPVRDAVLSSRPVGLRRLYLRDWAATSAGEGPAVMHVLVATDLLSGDPFYFSGKFVHCRPYGWSTPGTIRTAAAVYSSAAFPGVFPPKKLKMSKLL